MKRRVLLLLGFACLCCPLISLHAQQPTIPSEKPHLVIVIAEGEYKTDQTLPLFAKDNLNRDFRVTILQASKDDRNNIPGIEAVNTADALLLSVRRRTLPPQQLAVIRTYVEQGKPLIAIRTACHAFCLRNESPPSQLADWPEFDPQVLGGHYVNHHGNEVQSYVKMTKAASSHPILRGISTSEFRVFGSLYRCQPLTETTTLLMTGRAEDIQPHEPVAWTNKPKSGNRVFYTSLGHPQDFKLPDFVRLLRNGVYWAAGHAVPDSDVVTQQHPPEK